MERQLKLFVRQNKALVSECEPVAQRQANHSSHDRAGVIHRVAGDRQEGRKREESHAVDPPRQSQAVDGHAPFAQAPRAWCWESAFESSDDDQCGWDYVGGVESQRGERGSFDDVSVRCEI